MKLLLIVSLLVLLFSISPVALAAYARTIYKPAHWSGLVRKYDASGRSIGWKWGGGLRQPGSGLRWAVNAYGRDLGYQVKVGSCYGCVR